MRKTALAAVIASAVVITLGGTTALAFGHTAQNGGQNSIAGTTDMVYNQNSKCEYCEEYGHHYTDADNDGICDYCTHDTDNNGICDYCTRNTDNAVPACRHGYSTSGICDGSGCRHALSVSCGGSGHHAGHGYGHR